MRVAILALAIALPLAALAEDEPRREDCQRVLDSFRAPGAAPAGSNLPIRAWLDDGWCVVQGITYGAVEPPQPGFRINRLLWRGADVTAVADRRAPLSLQLRIEGFRIVPRIGRPATDYILRAQSRAAASAIDATLGIRRDPDARTLTIEYLKVDFPGDNAIEMSAEAARVDLSSPAAAQMSLGSMGLTDLSLDVESNGLFESYVLMALGPLLLEGADDPEARVAELRGEAKAALALVPATILPDASKAALVRFLDDLPNPVGTARLTISSPDGIGAARFMRFAATGGPRSVTDFVTALDGVSAEFSYDK